MYEIRPFNDRREVLFGRTHAIEVLRRRAENSGLTALVGRPQSGKSWLLEELARTLSEEQNFLVGYQESKGGAPDNVLRAVQDLYTRWLTNSTYRDQARAIYEQQKGSVLSDGVSVLANVFSEMSSVAKPISKLVESGLNSLLRAHEDLTTGRLVLPPLQYEQAKELLVQVHNISGKSLILILDAWEQTVASALEDEYRLLHAFVRDRKDWPTCHIFVSLRRESHAVQHIETLHREFDMDASIIPLEPMDLSNTSEKRRLIQYLHEHISVSRSINDHQLISMIGGYAGVVGRWINRSIIPENEQVLRQLAEDAHTNRYPEIETLIDRLSNETRGLAIRLALLDNSGIESWPRLKDILLLECRAIDLDNLTRCGLLENSNPPTYGHAKRAEIARLIFHENYNNGFIEELCKFVEACADRITRIDSKSLPFSAALLTVSKLIDDLPSFHLERNVECLLLSAKTLFKIPVSNDDLLGCSNIQHGYTLLAVGLSNMMVTNRVKGKLELQEKYLYELISLSEIHSEPEIRNQLARGMYNNLRTLISEGNIQGQNAILTKLRTLNTKYDEPGVRKWLAWSLFKTLDVVTTILNNNTARRDNLLEELQVLSENHDEMEIHQVLSRALFNVRNESHKEGNYARRDVVLSKLRVLASKHKDSVIHKLFANGLYNNLHATLEEGNVVKSDLLLQELRSFCKLESYPEVLEILAKGISETIFFEIQNKEPSIPYPLIKELRSLVSDRHELGMRKQLAMGILNTVNISSIIGNLDFGCEMLDELFTITDTYRDEIILLYLTAGIIRMIEATQTIEDIESQFELIKKLVHIFKLHKESNLYKWLNPKILLLISQVEEKPQEFNSMLLRELNTIFKEAMKELDIEIRKVSISFSALS